MKTRLSSDPASRSVNTAVTAMMDSISVWTKGQCKSRDKTSDRKGFLYAEIKKSEEYITLK